MMAKAKVYGPPLTQLSGSAYVSLPTYVLCVIGATPFHHVNNWKTVECIPWSESTIFISHIMPCCRVNIAENEVFIPQKRCDACPAGTTCVDYLCSGEFLSFSFFRFCNTPRKDYVQTVTLLSLRKRKMIADSC